MSEPSDQPMEEQPDNASHLIFSMNYEKVKCHVCSTEFSIHNFGLQINVDPYLNLCQDCYQKFIRWAVEKYKEALKMGNSL